MGGVEANTRQAAYGGTAARSGVATAAKKSENRASAQIGKNETAAAAAKEAGACFAPENEAAIENISRKPIA